MPEYNLGRAHGVIRVDYEGEGARKAQEGVKDVGDEAKRTATKIDSSTQESTKSYKRLGDTVKQTKVTPEVDRNAFQRLVDDIRSVEKSTKRGVLGFNTFNSRLRFMVGGIALASPGVAGLGVSLAALSGLAGIAAGALAGLAAAGSTLAVGMSGIGDVFKEAANQSKSAGTSARASAKAQRAAAQAIESAKRSLTDAEENLTRVREDAARAAIDAARQVLSAERGLVDAQRDAVRAQQSLSKARQEATRQLEDMRSALTGGALDERQAVLDLQRAEEELAAIRRDPTANARDIAQAILNLEKQQFALSELRKENQRLVVDEAAAAAAGVAGSDQVVDAQDRVRESAQSVRDAQQSLADAQENVRLTQVESSRAIRDAVEQVAEAQRNLQEAYRDAAEAGTEAGAKMADAMANLSPNAQAFVKEVLAQKGAWDQLKKSVQDRLFDGLADEVAPLAETWFPLLEEGMGKVADSLNGIIDGIVEFAKSTETQANVSHIFDNTSLAIDNMRNVVRDLLFALMDIAAVASDFLPDMANDAGGAAARFREFINEARETGKLRQWMEDAKEAASQLWQLLKNLGSIIGSVFTGLDQSGGGALNTLTNLTGKVAEFLKTAEAQEGLRSLGAILQSIGGAYAKVFLSFLKTAADLLVALEPLIVSVADHVGPMLGGAFLALGAALEPVFEILSWLSPFLGPFIASIYAMNKAVGLAKTVWAALNTTMKANPFILVASLIAALALLIIENWDTISAKLAGVWENIKVAGELVWGQIRDKIIEPAQAAWDFLVNMWDTITGFLTNAWNVIRTTTTNTWNSIGTTIRNAISAVKTYISDRIDDIVGFFRDLPSNIRNAVSNLVSTAFNIGKDIINGILRGIGNLASRVGNKLREMASDAWDSVKSFFGISSPSKLMAYAGEMIGEGLVKGILAMRGAVADASDTLAEATGSALTGASGTLAAHLAVSGTASGTTGGTAAVLPAVAPNIPTKDIGDAMGAKTIVIENLILQVAGNLDPSNPVAFRETIKRLKEALRNIDREY